MNISEVDLIHGIKRVIIPTVDKIEQYHRTAVVTTGILCLITGLAVGYAICVRRTRRDGPQSPPYNKL